MSEIERPYTDDETALIGIVSKMHTAWMRRNELMGQQGGFDLMERMADLMDQIVDEVPTLWKTTIKAVAPRSQSERVSRLEEALKEIIDPIQYMQQRAEAKGDHLSYMADCIARDPEYLRNIARSALNQADKMEERLSDEAIMLAFDWFSFGSKASVTSSPPHANMKAQQAALDELLAANLITHEHEYHKRHGIDRHHFKGTAAIRDVLSTDRAKRVLKTALDRREEGVK